MKKYLPIIAVAVLAFSLCGCEEQLRAPSAQNGDCRLLSVDFQKEQPLRYRFVSERDVELKLSNNDNKKTQKASESLDMVVSYELVEQDIYGVSTIKATCESVKVERASFSKSRRGKADAVESIAGKSWSFKVNPLGKLEDTAGLEKLLKEIGAKSIKEQGKRRIKDQDMIWDVYATQWFMWNPIESIEDPVKGVCEGQKWSSYLSVPFATLVAAEREVDYTLAEKAEDQPENQVVIDAEYSLAKLDKDLKGNLKTKLGEIPSPYEGSYQMRGMFGFLRSYKPMELAGSGKVVFDAERGVLVSNKQSYTLDMFAAFMFPLGDSVPELKVDQKIEVYLLD